MVPGAASELAFGCESRLYFVNRSYWYANFFQATAVSSSHDVLHVAVGVLDLGKSSSALALL